jgi:hypothetical protein
MDPILAAVITEPQRRGREARAFSIAVSEARQIASSAKLNRFFPKFP